MRVDTRAHQATRTTVTPQLAQQIRLLGLTSEDLEVEVGQWLASNVMLEVDADDADDGEVADDTGNEDAAGDLALDSNWDDSFTPMSGGAERFDSALPVAAPEPDGVVERLMRDLPVECSSARELHAAFAVLGAIDERGWLEGDLNELACSQGLPTGALIAALALIRKLAPAGFGARDLDECLRLQLDAMPDSAMVRNARALIAVGLERLAGRELLAVQRKLRLDDAAFSEALNCLRRLDPHPGRSAATGAPVLPDVVVARVDGRWTVTLSEFATPRLRINPGYASVVESGAPGSAGLRDQLQEARWLLRGLEQRADTLLKVAHAIFRRQFAFLAGGDEVLAPMMLREIAGEVGVHESTVSRVTRGKYVATPRGIYELKHFFGAGFGADCGASNTAARALVRRFIAGERPDAPLDDAAVAERLAERGIRIARRTVAKYRESLGIPPARMRAAAQPLALSA
ncbi:RNA polymerase factor sigma-54 [Algiphilus sp.]|uniref:RNA polymerase factor sigma-54 n=1 Tax=Algiphilus sp. TaxID=1872431 RepID=UPI0025BC8520|nr:RNA polymerase factor sigma-54 [Algiphilus sp.]MCK5771356.1 RNA polymerase factor sigma-54 [Algiphilus sp.]